MRWGTPWACGWGSHSNHFQYVIPDLAEMITRGYQTCPVRLKRRAGLGNAQTQIYVNTVKAAEFYDDTGDEYEVDVPVPYGANSFSIEAIRIGQLRNPLYECSHALRITEHVENKRITLHWTFTPKVVEPENSGGSYTSSWSFTGLMKGTNCAHVDGHETWGRLTFTLTVATGTATLEIFSNGVLVASGSAAVGTTLTFTGDTLNGTVAIDALAASTTGILDIRWPREMKIKRDTSNPPTTVVATVPFTGSNEERWTEPDELAGGTYYYRIQPVSDTGKDGTASSIKTLVVIAAPEPPTDLMYDSGDASALVMAFTPSATPLVTYNLYGALNIGDTPNMNEPLDTAFSGSVGPITGYPGTARFLVRAVLAGVEERNGEWLELEFDNTGQYVTPRPNNAGIISYSLDNGLDMTLRGTYNPIREKAPATKLNIYTKLDDGVDTYPGTPDATVALSNSMQGMLGGTLTFTFPSAGYYKVKIRAATADDIEGLDGDEIQVLASDEVLPAATDFDGELSRA